MDRSREGENSYPGGCESLSAVQCVIEENSDKKRSFCQKTSQDFTGVKVNERSPDDKSSVKQEYKTFTANVKEEDLSEQSDTSFDDSSSVDSSDDEEFADLLTRCYPKFRGDAQTKSTEEDEQVSEAALRASQLPGTSTPNFKCLPCQKNFSNFQNLERHMLRNHSSEKQHCCPQCNKSYSLKCDLTQHIKFIHGERKYSCDKCDFTSRYSRHLSVHISAVHTENNRLKCPQCDLYFTQKCSLTRHIRSIHNQEKSFECSSCDKKFTRRGDLNIHWRSVHCGEKPYTCDQCDYKCSQKSHLTRHLRTVHKPCAT